jgi:hypothetical protein
MPAVQASGAPAPIFDAAQQRAAFLLPETPLAQQRGAHTAPVMIAMSSTARMGSRDARVTMPKPSSVWPEGSAGSGTGGRSGAHTTQLRALAPLAAVQTRSFASGQGVARPPLPTPVVVHRLLQHRHGQALLLLGLHHAHAEAQEHGDRHRAWGCLGTKRGAGLMPGGREE